METTKKEYDEFTQKILNGAAIALKKLVLKLREMDEELVFSRDGKIVRVKAKDIEV
jgi:hypothetical protein